MTGQDANARRINAIIEARRRSAETAGHDDGERAGFYVGYYFEQARHERPEDAPATARLDVKKYADPRWRKDPAYRRAFARAAKRAFVEGRETYLLSI
jgi:hypothetical protein